MTYEFDAELWLWSARTDSWTFVSLPTDVADEVLERGEPVARGGGGTSAPPVKRAGPPAEGLATGDTVRVRLTLVDV